MSGTRLVRIAVVLAIALASGSTESGASRAPSAPAPLATAAAARPPSSLPGGVVPGDSTPSPLRIGTIAVPTRQTTLPILRAEGAVVGGASLNGGSRAYGSRASGLLRLGLPAGFTLEGRTALLVLDRGDVVEQRTMRSEARIRHGRGGYGTWLGAGFERPIARAQEPAAVEMGLGAWAAPGEVALALALQQSMEYARVATVLPPEPVLDHRLDTIPRPDRTVFDDRLVRSTSALVSGRWAHRRFGVESVAGVTFNRHFAPRRWMQASFDVAVLPRLAVYATLGSAAPRWLALEPGLSRGATMGLKLTSAVNAALAEGGEPSRRAPGFRLRHLDDDWYVIEVRAKAAGPVEVIGDFSAWEPRPLRHVTGSRWALALRLSPGVHQIQVRVDGGLWAPPDGLPTASDGFNGDVGVFVAR